MSGIVNNMYAPFTAEHCNVHADIGGGVHKLTENSESNARDAYKSKSKVSVNGGLWTPSYTIWLSNAQVAQSTEDYVGTYSAPIYFSICSNVP